MRPLSLRYLLWVLLPVAAAGAAGHLLQTRESLSVSRASTHHLGGVAALLLRGRMAALAGELGAEALEVPNPDPSSPLLSAALAGDTVVALGKVPEGITLSLALAEGPGDSLRIRAATAPFPQGPLELFRNRTGLGIALYLRGARGLASPPDFGPATLPPGGSRAEGRLSSGNAFLPLAGPQASSSSPARILVGPPRPTQDTPGRRGWFWLLLLFWTPLGLWGADRTGPPAARRVPALTLNGLPLLLLWALLFGITKETGETRDDALRGDLVRVLALVKEEAAALPGPELQESVGIHLARSRNGVLLESTLPAGELEARILTLPLPPPTYPTTGQVEVARGFFTYARARTEEGETLTLLRPSSPEAHGRLALLLSFLGGGASILSLGYLRGGRAREVA